MPKNIVKKIHTIGYDNVEELVNQFNMHHLTCERTSIKTEGRGYQDIKIDETFRNNAINELVELVGGHKKTRDKVRFQLRNEPQHTWFADRFVYEGIKRGWVYIDGQDGRREKQMIRNYFNRL